MLTLTVYLPRARMNYMNKNNFEPESRVNQTLNEKLYLKNNQMWEESGKILPVGLFTVSRENTLISINSAMRNLVGLQDLELKNSHYQEFFSSLVTLTEEPEIVSTALDEGVKNIHNRPVINLTLGEDSPGCLELLLFPIELKDDNAPVWGGLMIDRSVESNSAKRRVDMLLDMSSESRKVSAALQGYFEALSGNLQTWSDELIEDFLSDINQQLGLLRKSLDQMITFLGIFDRITFYPETVQIYDLLNEVIQTSIGMENRVILVDPEIPDFPTAQLDPGLTRLGFEYILMEILEETLPDNRVIVKSRDLGETVMISFQTENLLSIPEFEEQTYEVDIDESNPRIYLARRLISAQGGIFSLLRPRTDRGAGVRIEVTFGLTLDQEIFKETEISPGLEDALTGRILVADPQPEYQALLQKVLEERGYRVDLAGDGSTALDMVQVINPDLVVVDRNLPGLDGIMITQGIRRWSSVPIIMVSSRSHPEDLIHAFQTGVDDYLKKPFLMDEILARIEANIRRGKDSSKAFTPDVFQSGNVRINYSTRQVWLQGKPIDLTPIEYNLLSYMSRHRKQIMAYEQLIERVWDGPDKGTRQGLFVHIRRLREKIEKDPKNPKIIQNQWGVGYIFSP